MPHVKSTVRPRRRKAERPKKLYREFEVWGVKGNRAKLLAIMYFLHLLAPHLVYVILPRARIAEWLGLSDKTTGRLIREMDQLGFIRINRNVDGSGRSWSYTAKQAREGALVGLGEEVAREVAASGECVRACDHHPRFRSGDRLPNVRSMRSGT